MDEVKEHVENVFLRWPEYLEEEKFYDVLNYDDSSVTYSSDHKGDNTCPFLKQTVNAFISM